MRLGGQLSWQSRGEREWVRMLEPTLETHDAEGREIIKWDEPKMYMQSFLYTITNAKIIVTRGVVK